MGLKMLASTTVLVDWWATSRMAMIGSALGLLSAVTSVLLQWLKSRVRRIETRIATMPLANDKGGKPKTLADYEYETRLSEANYALERQEKLATISRWSSNSLIFCQYVIGGVLATSFIQSTLSPGIVGALGVLVLVSSLIQQRFRPDVQFSNAKERALIIRELIRRAEDDIYAICTSHPNAKPVLAIREMISGRLTLVESMELADVTPGRTQKKH